MVLTWHAMASALHPHQGRYGLPNTDKKMRNDHHHQLHLYNKMLYISVSHFRYKKKKKTKTNWVGTPTDNSNVNSRNFFFFDNFYIIIIIMRDPHPFPFNSKKTITNFIKLKSFKSGAGLKFYSTFFFTNKFDRKNYSRSPPPQTTRCVCVYT